MKITTILTALFKGGFYLQRRFIAVIVMLSAILSAHAAYADNGTSARFKLPYLGGNLGLSKVQNSDRYDTSEAINAYAGVYLFNNLSAEIWAAFLGRFDVNGHSDTYSQASGLGTSLAYRIDTGRLFALRPSVGVFYSKSKIVFEGNEIGTDIGASLMLGLSGVFTIREHLLVNINSHFFKDVSGSDIVLLTAGAGYQF